MAEETFFTQSEEATQKWAEQFARNLKVGDAVALIGDLGAGKTVFARGIARGFNFKGYVTSPSFALVNEYDADVFIYHIDLYRLEPDADWDEIGIDHYLTHEGITLIEWPERVNHLDIEFDYQIAISYKSEGEREIRVIKRE
ncbi:MAG: tRNA (adenosine(37)-N6)-threonylcarbamoyltransferase complex ATPase subunit type 1 TsaE [Fibrobacteria bacterium]|nr:tRNA (adenosine(37)-N6)-threonylcarbamoyltransferase complex ATPase subunit type 1 TsaE [Fibrobacteria bacterium]